MGHGSCEEDPRVLTLWVSASLECVHVRADRYSQVDHYHVDRDPHQWPVSLPSERRDELGSVTTDSQGMHFCWACFHNNNGLSYVTGPDIYWILTASATCSQPYLASSMVRPLQPRHSNTSCDTGIRLAFKLRTRARSTSSGDNAPEYSIAGTNSSSEQYGLPSSGAQSGLFTFERPDSLDMISDP